MNSNDFISLKGVKWGEYPYYYGDTYNEGSIYFATLGCKKAFQYKDFAEGMTSINVSEKANYLSLYNNGGLKEYYGDGLFQKNNNLATSEDFIRNNNIDILALTIPKTSANIVAQAAVEAGIRGIWNFAHMDLTVPEGVVVENVHLSESLMTLSYNLGDL